MAYHVGGMFMFKGKLTIGKIREDGDPLYAISKDGNAGGIEPSGMSPQNMVTSQD